MRNEWIFISYKTEEKLIDQDLFLFVPIPDVFQMRNLSNWMGNRLDLLGLKEPKHWHNHVAQHHLKCSSFPRSLGWNDQTEKNLVYVVMYSTISKHRGSWAVYRPCHCANSNKNDSYPLCSPVPKTAYSLTAKGFLEQSFKGACRSTLLEGYFLLIFPPLVVALFKLT